MSSAIPSPSGQAPGGADESASGAPACPLDELQFLLLRQAVIRRRPIRRAARVARSSAWTILVIGLAGWPVAMLVPSLTGFFVVAGISFVGVMEYIGSGRMWRGERSAPGFLARTSCCSCW